MPVPARLEGVLVAFVEDELDPLEQFRLDQGRVLGRGVPHRGS
jgi:hypothetical protein